MFHESSSFFPIIIPVTRIFLVALQFTGECFSVIQLKMLKCTIQLSDRG